MKYIPLVFIIVITTILCLYSCQKSNTIDSSNDFSYILSLQLIREGLSKDEKVELDDSILEIIVSEYYGEEVNINSLRRLQSKVRENNNIDELRSVLNGLSYKDIKKLAAKIERGKSSQITNLSNYPLAKQILSKLTVSELVYNPLSQSNVSKEPYLELTIVNNSDEIITNIAGRAKMTHNGSVYYEPEFSYEFEGGLEKSNGLVIRVTLNDSIANQASNLYIQGSPIINFLSFTNMNGEVFRIEEDETTIADEIIENSGLDPMEVIKYSFLGKLL